MYLKEGDLIGIVSPSRAISEQEIQTAVLALESEGFRVAVGDNAHKVDRQFAGTDAEKVADIQRFIEDKEVKAIWSSRGGYGAVRIIDQINFKPLLSNFKWMIGYSDFTVFHSHLNKNLALPSLHATMPVNVKPDMGHDEKLSLDSMIRAIRGEELVYEIDANEHSHMANAEGELVGGNLSILYSLCGSASDLDTDGKILFIEDLDEYLYHIDRMMMNLKRTGKLDGLAALVVGGMSDMNDNTIPYGKTAEEIILDHTSEYNYPKIFGFEAGHLSKNLALRFGKKAVLKNNSLILPS